MNGPSIPKWANSDEVKVGAGIAGLVLLLIVGGYWNAARVAARSPSEDQVAAADACVGVRWPKGGKVSMVRGALDASKVALCDKQDLFCSAAVDACKQRRTEAIDGALRKLRNDSSH